MRLDATDPRVDVLEAVSEVTRRRRELTAFTAHVTLAIARIFLRN
jgi:hypothetical protein